jgi:glycosyltransferase involved in cell wall biosynthesis
MSRSLSFSVVTPSFNQGRFIGEAIDSVLVQAHCALEHHVIDGGSTDGTVDILRARSQDARSTALHWISEPDRGQSHALNKGFTRVTGDIIGWLNADDRYLPGCFEHVARVFMEYPEVDIVYGDYRWIDEDGRAYRIRREIEFSAFVLLYHRVLYIPTTATFFRRHIFEDGHYLNESLHYALDFDFFVRLAGYGYRFRHIPAVLADFRFHNHSKTCTSPQKQLQEQRQVAEQYSPILRSMKSPTTRLVVRTTLGALAASLRYSEKLFRGYYFSDSFREPMAPSSRSEAPCMY